jgi:Zn-dependent peptidase ImmA (M78 family)
VTHVDRQANIFAMHLLIPLRAGLDIPRGMSARRFVAKIDLNDDDAIAQLAKKYRVSVPIMTARLTAAALVPADPAKGETT